MNCREELPVKAVDNYGKVHSVFFPGIHLKVKWYLVERETRFELATSTLARLHSTTELLPQAVVFLLQIGREVNSKIHSPEKTCAFRLVVWRIKRFGDQVPGSQKGHFDLVCVL